MHRMTFHTSKMCYRRCDRGCIRLMLRSITPIRKALAIVSIVARGLIIFYLGLRRGNENIGSNNSFRRATLRSSNRVLARSEGYSLFAHESASRTRQKSQDSLRGMLRSSTRQVAGMIGQFEKSLIRVSARERRFEGLTAALGTELHVSAHSYNLITLLAGQCEPLDVYASEPGFFRVRRFCRFRAPVLVSTTVGVTGQ